MIAASHLDEQCEALGAGHFAAHRGDDGMMSTFYRLEQFVSGAFRAAHTSPFQALRRGL